MSVELRHLRSFVAVAEEGHVGRAAERLFISQPPLSRQLQQLERALGVVLFERTPRGVVLTDEGEKFLAKAQRVLAAADDALGGVQAIEVGGRLALGLPLGGMSPKLIELVDAFLEQHELVEMDVRHEITRELQREVREQRLDAAIGFCPLELPELAYTPLFDEELQVLMRDDHHLAARARLTFDDLAAERVVVVGGRDASESGYSLLVRRLFDEAGIEPQFVEIRAILPPHPLDDGVTVSINVAQDMGPGIVSVPLVPAPMCPFALIRRRGTQRPLVASFFSFAVAYATDRGWATA